MDAVDQAILRRLQRDGRQTNRELAEALGIAPSTALERTRALRARGVIAGFHAAVDLAALGHSVQALISIRIRPQSREAIETVQGLHGEAARDARRVRGDRQQGRPRRVGPCQYAVPQGFRARPAGPPEGVGGHQDHGRV